MAVFGPFQGHLASGLMFGTDCRSNRLNTKCFDPKDVQYSTPKKILHSTQVGTDFITSGQIRDVVTRRVSWNFSRVVRFCV